MALPLFLLFVVIHGLLWLWLKYPMYPLTGVSNFLVELVLLFDLWLAVYLWAVGWRPAWLPELALILITAVAVLATRTLIRYSILLTVLYLLFDYAGAALNAYSIILAVLGALLLTWALKTFVKNYLQLVILLVWSLILSFYTSRGIWLLYHLSGDYVQFTALAPAKEPHPHRHNQTIQWLIPCGLTLVRCTGVWLWTRYTRPQYQLLADTAVEDMELLAPTAVGQRLLHPAST